MPATFARWGALLLAPLAFCHATAAPSAPLAPAPLSLHLSVLESGSAAPGPGQAYLQIGTVSAAPARNRLGAIVRRQRVAVRLEGTAAHARLSVALANEMPGYVVRVDGLALSTIPRIVAPAHRIGATVFHEVEITIDPGVPAGPFLSNLQWVADSD